jgi:hypothetical protein
MRIAILLLVVICAGCGSDGGSPVAPSSPTTQQPAPVATAHFTFFPTSLDAGNITATADSLEAEYGRITRDLGVDAMPRVNVHFYSDQAALRAAMRPLFGALPSFAIGLATSSTEIHLVSPNQPAVAPYSVMVSNLVHEFAHCVSLHLNPTIANNPRWFWESVAIYESGQLVEPRTLSYMVQGMPPAFSTLNTFENGLVYDIGYTIGAFIVARGGQRALIELIVNNGNVAQTMRMSQAEFEREWFDFVRARYGI